MALSDEPTLPVELFQAIINEVAEHPTSSYEADIPAMERLDNLTKCALVCKTFAQICRPHIFDHVHTGFGLTDTHLRDLRSFIDSTTNNPDLLPLVHKLSVDTTTVNGDGTYYDNPMVDDIQVQQIISTLSAFPNLHWLDLCSWDYTPRYGPDDPRGIQRQLLSTYLSQGTLRTLVVDDLPSGITPNMVISAPGLTHWIVSYSRHYPSTSAMSTNVDAMPTLQRLKVYDSWGKFYVDFLDHCPHIRHLHLPEKISFTPSYESIPRHTFKFDSSKLKSLQLKDLTVFPEFCRVRHRLLDDRDRKMWQDLEDLVISLSDLQNLHSAREMLKETCSLLKLEILVYMYLCHSALRILDLEIHQRFLDGSFKNLAHLDLILSSLSDTSGYNDALESMETIFNAASGCNILQKISFSISFKRVARQSILAIAEAPFPGLDKIRAVLNSTNDISKPNFPLLREVKLTFSFQHPSGIPEGKPYPAHAVVLIKNGVTQVVQKSCRDY